MKYIRLLAALAVLFVSIPLVRSAEKSDDTFSEKNLRRLIVAHPDSLLMLLDIAQECSAVVLPQYKIELLRGLAYNEKRMPSLVERYALRGLASDSVEEHPAVKLNLLTLLADARTVSGNYQGCIDAATQGIEVARALGNRPAEYNLLTTMAQVAFGMGDRKQGYAYNDTILTPYSADTYRKAPIASP